MRKKINFDLDEFRNQPLPSEKEIILSWTSDRENPVVSVICNTFNQESYIEDAIRGFLIQQTNFPFEIIIHDDASTDRTKNIVGFYSSKYPRIIRTVFQTENQYRQNKKPTLISSKYARGQYLALCEGDDFWVSPKKLQSQKDILDSYEDVDIVFHSAFMMSENGGLKLFCDHGGSQLKIGVNKVIRTGGPCMPTASIVVRRRYFDVVVKANLEFFEKYHSGYFLQVFASLRGGALYLPEPLSVYRTQALGSWSLSIKNSSKQFKKWVLTFIEACDEAESIIGSHYGKDFEFVVRSKVLSLANNENISVSERRNVVKSYSYALKMQDFFLWKLVFSKPFVHKIAKRIRSSLKK
ncbi:glycosyltransferase family 2 protein [Marinobacter nauticus]|uniref:glycosyltransferase family 2 protein n=1 Tax=Marinobacter nauticus TaxID=2743 RepID=UPI003518F173